ncbi:MAG TPA: alpha/beta hydrolase [Terriglobales bacterium]|nr:alpha/beta hydrolase [Terriglobales bacterium]
MSGGRLRYLVQGTGAPLLLLHGIVASSFSFRLVSRELSREFRLFVPDLRVAGADASLRATATRILELLDHECIESADLLGSSHGGAVAMELTAMAPERIRRLILVSPANPFARGYHRVVNFYLSRPGGIVIRLAPFAPIPIWEYAMQRMCGRTSRLATEMALGYRQPLRERGMTTHIRSSLQTFTAEIEALREKLPDLRKIQTLLIWGDSDPVVELGSGHQLQQALGAEMAVMPGIGHLPYEESPEKFNRIVLNYLRIGPSGDRVIESSGEVNSNTDKDRGHRGVECNENDTRS